MCHCGTHDLILVSGSTMRDDAYIVMQGPVLRVFFAILMRSTKDFCHDLPRPRASRSPGRLALRESAAEPRHSRARGRREGGARGGGEDGGGGDSVQQRRWTERGREAKEEEGEEREEAAVEMPISANS